MIRSLFSLAAVAGLLLALNQSVPAQNKAKPDDKAKPGDKAKPDDKGKLVISSEAKLIIELTNKARASAKPKLRPLTANALLFKCAEGHSLNMAKQMKAGHDLDGKNPADRVDATGYYYKTCGENVAYLPVDKVKVINTKGIFDGWMNSPIHRREILRAEYEEIGIGIAKDGVGNIYYTQVFGTEVKPGEGQPVPPAPKKE